MRTNLFVKLNLFSMPPIKRFLVIDDDPLNNKICKILISKTLNNIEVQTFETPEKALELFINEKEKNIHDFRTLVLLDLNMYPTSG